MINVELSDMADLMECISQYEKMGNMFTQLTSGKDREVLVNFWKEKIVKDETRTWMSTEEYTYWKDINFHVINQMWGNTSGGWQGIGGSAMTSAYTVIIENLWYGLACIYYGGTLAYMCEIDDKYTAYMEKGYRGLPGLGDCRRQLNVIYKK